MTTEIEENEILSDDIDSIEMRELFLEDNQELLENLHNLFQQWNLSPGDIAISRQIKDILRTMLGAARLAGIQSIANLVHALRMLVDNVSEEFIKSSPDIFSLIQQAIKHIAQQNAQVRTGGPVIYAKAIITELDLTYKNMIEQFPLPPPVQEKPVQIADDTHNKNEVAIKVTRTEGAVLVMIVDDSITARKITSRLLKLHNMDVVTARDGVDAMAILQDHVPDVILLDTEMPRMDGYELEQYIRSSSDERIKHIPIIMCNGRGPRTPQPKIGIKRYIGKPYQEDNLLYTIREVLTEAMSR